MLQYPLQSVILPTPPRCHRRQPESFSEELARERRQKRHDSRRLDDTAAESVGDGNVTRVNGLDEPRDSEERVAAQFERIAETIVYAAENHIDRPQALHCLQENLAVANREVRAFHKRQAKIPGQIGMFEICLIERTWREQYHL